MLKPIIWSLLVPMALSSVACSAETGSENLATTDQAVCANPDGVDAVLAALAVVTAKEMKHWSAKDFKIVNNTVTIGATGIAACGGGTYVCQNVQAILDLQKPAANGQIKFTDGTVLNSDAYRSRAVSYLQRQLSCEAQPDNHNDSNCPAEAHRLVWESQVPGSCDKDDWFAAYRANCLTDDISCKLVEPSQLKNKLIMFGQPSNVWLAFQLNADKTRIGIDPAVGLTETYIVGGGGCQAISTTNVAGQACSCLGASGTLRAATFNANTYLCR